jgi:hypothetical protein
MKTAYIVASVLIPVAVLGIGVSVYLNTQKQIIKEHVALGNFKNGHKVNIYANCGKGVKPTQTGVITFDETNLLIKDRINLKTRQNIETNFEWKDYANSDSTGQWKLEDKDTIIYKGEICIYTIKAETSGGRKKRRTRSKSYRRVS